MFLKKDGILSRGFFSIAIKLIGLGLGFFANIILARILGVEQYSIYSYTIAIFSVLAVPAMLGLPTLIVRETAKNFNKDWGVVRGLWTWANKVVAFMSILIALIIFIYIYFGENSYSEIEIKTLLWGVLFIPLSALAAVRSASLRGLGKTIKGQLPEQVFKPFFLVVFIWIAYIYGVDNYFKAFHAVMFNSLSAGIAFLLGSWILIKNKPCDFSSFDKKNEIKFWRKSIIPFSMLSGLSIISTQTDILMLGVLGDANDVGLYKVAIQGADLVALGIMAANMVTMPEMAKIAANDARHELAKIAHKNARFSASVAFLGVLILLLFGEFLISISFGEEYLKAYYPLMLLSIGQLINATLGQGGVVLNMCGKERATLITLMLTGCLNILLNYLFIPYWGMNGAAAATLISILCRKLIIWFMLFFAYKIDSSIFGIKFELCKKELF